MFTFKHLFSKKKADKIYAVIGVLAGISLTSLKFGNNALIYLTNARYNLSTNFFVDMLLDLILPRNQGE